MNSQFRPVFSKFLGLIVDHLRTGLCLLFVSVGAVTAWADETAMPQARKLLLRGKYAEAADLYSPLATKLPAAAVGLARGLAAQGKDDAAEEALAAAPGRDAGVLAERAAMAFGRGKVENSRKWADEAIRIDRGQLLARWIVAELDRTSGRLDDAERGYRWLVTYYNDHDNMPAESLRWIGLAAARLARWNRQADQFQFLINELYPDALKENPDYWLAHYEAGMLLLEKHNRADAATEFRSALEINPNAAEAHLGVALASIEGRDIETAGASLARALEINPRLLGGWLLKADLLWANFQVHKALTLLEEKAMPLNPICEETLGRMAACHLLLGEGANASAHGAKLARLVEQVTRRNPHAGEFYFALAAQLEDRNKQTEAETYFREAIRVMPRQIGPQAHLGLLYMRAGREDEARRVLRRAFEADPFDLRVKNTLEVSDVLGAMQTLDSERFAIRFSGECDMLLARFAARHVARVLPELCERFAYTPPGKTLIEIFNRANGLDGHQWFSARMVGLPYLGTVAASTGRIVAMASPNEPGLGRQMNWSRVLTHELVHVVTLQQTRFNCPHWFTEGLAVWSERRRRPEAWDTQLRDRFEKGTLFNLDTLNFGFVRPQSGGDWQLAYCQAELYVEFMLKSHELLKTTTAVGDPGRRLGGEALLRRMLAAYRDGLNTPDAIRQVFGVSQDEFERGYRAFLKKELAKSAKAASIGQLRQAMEDHPDDAAAAAAYANADIDDLASRKKLAPMAFAAKDYAAAERWATEGIEIDVMDADLHRVAAEAAAQLHHYSKAVEEYEAVVELKPDDRKAQEVLKQLRKGK